MSDEVEDRVPLSEVDDLRVEMDRETTAGYALAKEDGTLRWTVPLGPGEKRSIELRYHLDLPRDPDLTGPAEATTKP